MLNLSRPKPFFYQGNQRAVLLLHGLTGTPQDMKRMGQYLHQQGYSCYGPIYEGHGLGAEALLKTEPNQWFQDAVGAYKHLQEQGFEQIAVIGHSMGGIFTLALAEQLRSHRIDAAAELKGLVTMCSPVQKRNHAELANRVVAYGKQYKELQRKDASMIEFEVHKLEQQNMDMLGQISDISAQAGYDLNQIDVPVFVVQGDQDGETYRRAARRIFSGAHTVRKYIKFYENSGHFIMYGKDKDQMHEDVTRFLNSLDWS